MLNMVNLVSCGDLKKYCLKLFSYFYTFKYINQIKKLILEFKLNNFNIMLIEYRFVLSFYLFMCLYLHLV